MWLLRSIAVFTPEVWQGCGIGGEATEATLAEGYYGGQEIKWGDTRPPTLSETDGDYDDEWLFINDKSNGRVAVIDLRDFKTRQIGKAPLSHIDHGGTFVTPDTEWVIKGSRYAHSQGGA